MTPAGRLARRIGAIRGGHGFVTISVSDAKALLAIVDTHRMAETENTGSVRSMSGDGAGTAIARKEPQGD